MTQVRMELIRPIEYEIPKYEFQNQNPDSIT
jgi:hypothetical protein